MSFDQLHRAWQRVANNRIEAAQQDGQFDNLPGFGCPLEDFVDLSDPNGWVRRMMKQHQISPNPYVSEKNKGPTIQDADRNSATTHPTTRQSDE